MVFWDCLVDTSAYEAGRSQIVKAALSGGFAWEGPALTTAGGPG